LFLLDADLKPRTLNTHPYVGGCCHSAGRHDGGRGVEGSTVLIDYSGLNFITDDNVCPCTLHNEGSGHRLSVSTCKAAPTILTNTHASSHPLVRMPCCGVISEEPKKIVTHRIDELKRSPLRDSLLVPAPPPPRFLLLPSSSTSLSRHCRCTPDRA
jgi:hypothetical protein